jgi:hypothetical protein
LITDTGKTFYGTATNNTQLDNYSLQGADDTIIGEGGDITIQTPYAVDTGTHVYLNALLGNRTTGLGDTITGVTDKISLHGSNNVLASGVPEPGVYTAPIVDSTITYTVAGNGGGNTVSLQNLYDSTVGVTLGTYEPAAGGNTVEIFNSSYDTDGTAKNTVAVTGLNNSVTLNGDATNIVSFSAGGANVTIGYYDDDAWGFGYTSKVTITGGDNIINGGDENFTINGSRATGGNNTIALGDGNNTITLGSNWGENGAPAATNNSITVWGGVNNIVAGSGGDLVQILGVDGGNDAAYSDNGDYNLGVPDDSPVPASPTDTVTIAGAGEEVDATYENLIILGSNVTDGAVINLGDGNNIIVLGGDGNNDVSVGNGANSINASGDNSYYTLGDGSNNGITLSGDDNTISADGGGVDTVQLGAGENDQVFLNKAGGSVTGTATVGTTLITQTGPLQLNVSLSGTGQVSLGDGNDTVSVGGPYSVVNLGNGNDTVTANGAGDGISVKNGDSTITANGANDRITVGDGTDKVTANGNGDHFQFGSGAYTVTAGGSNDIGTFGLPPQDGPTGNVTLDAEGSYDQWTLNEATGATVNATLGDHSELSQTGGLLNATLIGASDTLNLDGTSNFSTVANVGNYETVNFSGGAGGTVTLNPSSLDDGLSFTGASNKYTGSVYVSGLNSSDALTFNDIYGAAGDHITTAAELLSDLTAGAGGTESLKLLGGGAITFAANTPFTNLSFTAS